MIQVLKQAFLSIHALKGLFQLWSLRRVNETSWIVPLHFKGNTSLVDSKIKNPAQYTNSRSYLNSGMTRRVINM